MSSYVKDILCINVMLLTFNPRKKKQKTAYEIGVRLVGSEMCIRDRCTSGVKIGCDDPKVISRDEQGREICFMVKERKKPCPLNSLMKTSELSCQGYILY